MICPLPFLLILYTVFFKKKLLLLFLCSMHGKLVSTILQHLRVGGRECKTCFEQLTMHFEKVGHSEYAQELLFIIYA